MFSLMQHIDTLEAFETVHVGCTIAAHLVEQEEVAERLANAGMDVAVGEGGKLVVVDAEAK